MLSWSLCICMLHECCNAFLLLFSAAVVHAFLIICPLYLVFFGQVILHHSMSRHVVLCNLQKNSVRSSVIATYGFLVAVLHCDLNVHNSLCLWSSGCVAGGQSDKQQCSVLSSSCSVSYGQIAWSRIYPPGIERGSFSETPTYSRILRRM